LWTSGLQKALAWGTLLFFLGVPVVGLMTWLIRRIVRVRSRNRYLGWTFGGLWTIGWICAISFAASIAKDLRNYERVSEEVALTQPPNRRMIVRVNEPEIRYTGNYAWLQSENTGWDITDNQMKYNNVKIRIEKSDDSLYHATVYKYSAGSGIGDAQQRAQKTGFSISSTDSILNMGSGITIDRSSKFRGQGVILEIKVPVGKVIRFDESIIDAYNPWVVRRRDNDSYRWGRRDRYQFDWDNNEYFEWDANKDYVMNAEGKLVDPSIATEMTPSKKNHNTHSIRWLIEERERKNEKDRQRLEQGADSSGSGATGQKKKKEERTFVFVANPFLTIL
jgi:hypothetical protein